MEKLKVLLCGYVNYPNAQNINCDNIAKWLDKNIFDVHVMYDSSLPINKKDYNDLQIKLHRHISRRFVEPLLQWWIMVKGNYDIYYMPKRSNIDYKFAQKYWGKKCMISSVEGVVFRDLRNDYDTRMYMRKYMTSVFSISKCIKNSVKKYWDMDTEVLPLGVIDLHCEYRKISKLTEIIWVGNIKENKRPEYLLKCAEKFPEIHFTMVGEGEQKKDIEEKILKNNICNVTLTGKISNELVYSHMQKADLLLMTSKNEGLPKVIQEAAQCSVPSIYIGECYDVDFIENGKNGWKVNNIDQMIEQIKVLVQNPKILEDVSHQIYECSSNYIWEKLIPKYEKYFTEAYKKFENTKLK